MKGFSSPCSHLYIFSREIVFVFANGVILSRLLFLTTNKTNELRRTFSLIDSAGKFIDELLSFKRGLFRDLAEFRSGAEDIVACVLSLAQRLKSGPDDNLMPQ